MLPPKEPFASVIGCQADQLTAKVISGEISEAGSITLVGSPDAKVVEGPIFKGEGCWLLKNMVVEMC